MAKALYGHLNGADARLIREIRRLRARVADLEAHVERLEVRHVEVGKEAVATSTVATATVASDTVASDTVVLPAADPLTTPDSLVEDLLQPAG